MSYIVSKYYDSLTEDNVKCLLCPHNCIIKNGNTGICGVRHNIDGSIYAENYGKVVAMNMDPVEKKPLYHYYPGHKIFSVGTDGCNLKCIFCQNYLISQSDYKSLQDVDFYSPQMLVDIALRQKDNIGIAYTYNEPFIWFEYVCDTAKIAKNYALKNVMVTNGYINSAPLNELLQYMDAFNVDLKSFNNNFYKRHTGATLEPVLNTIKSIHKSGKHLEITNLVVTNLNDNADEFRNMVKWICENTGSNTPLHISRYFPSYKYSAPPTSAETIIEFYHIACEYLDFVYTGNIYLDKGNDTYCPQCGKTLILRNGYNINLQNITNDGKCEFCGKQIVISE